MHAPWSRRFGPALVMLAVTASASVLFAVAPNTRAAILRTCPASGPCPTPTQTPIPVHAFLSLDVTSGDATTVINVTGGQFLPNEQTTLFWDDPSKVAGGATADSSGSFNTRVKPFAADSPGEHKLCASVPPQPCARFTLLAPVISPTASPTPSESPSPSPIIAPTSGTTPPASLNGLGTILSPPFVFLPIAGFLAILLSVGYWLVNRSRRPRRIAPLPSAAVVHRATRPDYSAGFGTPPPAATPAPDPSAWHGPTPDPEAPKPLPQAEAPPTQSAPAPAPSPEPQWGPPVEWGTGSGDWGFPEPPPSDDSPEVPQPSD